MLGDESRRPPGESRGGLVATLGLRREPHLGQEELQVAASDGWRQDRAVLVLEEMLEVGTHPAGPGHRAGPATRDDRGLVDPRIWGSVAEADPVEPGLPVQIVVTEVPSARSEQDPLIPADLESPVLLPDGQHPRLHHDELVHGENTVGMSPHQSRPMHARLQHRGRRATSRSGHEDGIVPLEVGTGPSLR